MYVTVGIFYYTFWEKLIKMIHWMLYNGIAASTYMILSLVWSRSPFEQRELLSQDFFLLHSAFSYYMSLWVAIVTYIIIMAVTKFFSVYDMRYIVKVKWHIFSFCLIIVMIMQKKFSQQNFICSTR